MSKGRKSAKSEGVLSAAAAARFKKWFGPVREREIALAALNGPQPARSTKLPGRDRQAFAAKLDLDLPRLRAEHARRLAREEKQLEKRRLAALRHCTAAAKLLRGRVPVFTGGTLSPDGGRLLQWLDTPLVVWPTPTLKLENYSIQPFNTVAKVHWRRGNGGWSDFLSFPFRWTNHSANPAVISADGYLIFNGVAVGHVDSGWYIEAANQVAWAVYGGFSIAAEWDPAPTYLTAAPTETIVGMLLNGDDYFFYSSDYTRQQNVYRGYDLRTPLVTVPAGASVLLHMSVHFRADVDGGYVDADFATGAAALSTPGVLVTQWS